MHNHRKSAQEIGSMAQTSSQATAPTSAAAKQAPPYPIPPMLNPTHPIFDPTPPIVNPAPTIFNPTPPIVSPTPTIFDPTPPIFNPTSPIFHPEQRTLNLNHKLRNPNYGFHADPQTRSSTPKWTLQPVQGYLTHKKTDPPRTLP